MQNSSEGILSFLVHDMLDYAQISADKFRKMETDFNLKDCIEEILHIVNLKAEYLGVKIITQYDGFDSKAKLS